MSTKRKPTLKQLFNAWLKTQKKETEAYRVKCAAGKLAREINSDATELIEHEGRLYRITVRKYGYGTDYKVEAIANTVELPVNN